MTSQGVRWTEEDDALLCANWPKGGAKACAGLFSGRTDVALRRRADTLNLKLTPEALASQVNHAASRRWVATASAPIAEVFDHWIKTPCHSVRNPSKPTATSPLMFCLR